MHPYDIFSCGLSGCKSRCPRRQRRGLLLAPRYLKDPAVDGHYFTFLTVNFSGINLAFAPGSIYILFNSNKFHKFWMSCACRRSQSKDCQKWRKSRPPGLNCAGQPNNSTYMGVSLIQGQLDMFTMPLNQGSTPDSVGGPGRHEDQPKDPQVSAQMIKH